MFKGLAIGVGAISTALVGLAAKGIAYNATMEQYQTSFEVMLGSSEKALQLTEQLKEKAASTPFEMTDLANTTQLLLNYGISAEDVVDKMGMLGDISQGSAEKLNRVAMAYGQMSSLGKVQLEDIKQMIEAGFNPLQEISERTGESMESLYKRISKGTLSVEEITESMQYSTSEGGKYFESMEKQSQTFNGRLSTLKDNAMSALGAITTGLSDIAKDTVLPTLTGYVDRLATAFETGGFSGLFGELGSVLGDAFSQIATAAPQLVDGALGILQGLTDAIVQNIPVIIPAVIDILTSFTNFLLTNLPMLTQAAVDILLAIATGLGEQFPVLIPTLVQTLLSIVDILVANVPILIEAAFQILTGIANGIIEQLPVLIPAVIDLMMTIVGSLLENLPLLMSAAIDLIIALATGLIDAIPTLLTYIPQILDSIVQAITDLVYKLVEVGGNLVEGIWEGISAGTQWIYDQISGWVGGVIDWIKGLFGIASPSKEMADGVGKYISEGVGEGITDNVTAVTTAASQLSDAVVAEAATMNQAGVEVVNALGQGMLTRMMGLGKQLATWFNTAVVTPLRNLNKTFYELGRWMMMGFIIGMLSRKAEIVSDAIMLAKAATDAFRDNMRISSPSKVMYEFGEYFVQGFTSAVDAGVNDVRNAVSGLSNAALSFGSDVTQISSVNGATGGTGVSIGAINFNQPVTSPSQTASRISRELAGVLYA